MSREDGTEIKRLQTNSLPAHLLFADGALLAGLVSANSTAFWVAASQLSAQCAGTQLCAMTLSPLLLYSLLSPSVPTAAHKRSSISPTPQNSTQLCVNKTTLNK